MAGVEGDDLVDVQRRVGHQDGAVRRHVRAVREASEDDRERTALARRALRDAEAAIDELADAGAAALDAAGLRRLDATVRELDAALAELRR